MDLREYAAGPTQRAIADYLHAHPGVSNVELARALGKDPRLTSRDTIKMRKRAAAKDPSFHARGAPEGYRQKGVSTLVRADGSVVQQWIKTAREPDEPTAVLEAFVDAVEAREIAPVEPTPAPKDVLGDILAVYPLGDPHLGLVADAAVSGENTDLDHACGQLSQAVGQLVGLAPPAHTALIVNLADYYHADDQTRRTARSGNTLDADPRWHRVAQAGIETLIGLVELALTKHRHVILDIRNGNHDDHSSWMLALCLSKHYGKEPRVEVVLDPSMFWMMEWGSVLLATTHGHGPKIDELNEIMARDWPEAWGRTKYRHWYTGHKHHTHMIELRGCTVEIMRTLAARDAYAHGAGYRSGRSLVVDTWHKSKGHRTRHTIGVADLV